MKIFWLESAKRSLEQIAQYIAEDNKKAAYQAISKIKNTVDNLAIHPEIGRKGRVDGTRELVVANTNYLIIYRINDNRIEILHILHNSRKWPNVI